MSAAGLSASGTSSATVYIPGPSSRRKSSTVSAHIIPSNIRGEKQHKFYIPGETPSGGHFPTPKKVSSALCTTDPLHPGASVASAASGIRNQQSGASRDGILHYVYDKFLGVIQNTFKKETKLSETDIFNEACALRLAALYGANRGRGRRELEHLMSTTEFSKDELKLLYWGWKCSCPSGTMTESVFKEIYARFFPQAGDSSLYAHHVYRAMFSSYFREKGKDSVSFGDYAMALSNLIRRGNIRDKLEWTFRLYDINSDGKVTLDEMEEISKAIYSLLGYYVTPVYDKKTSSDHAKRVFEKLDPHHKGYVSLQEFLDVCSNDEHIVKSMERLDTTGLGM